MNTGSFVVSLDFELVWGIIEKNNRETYCKNNIINVGQAIKGMLDLFDQYDVKSTFAVVGFLMCHNKDELKKYSPNIKPSYTNRNLSPYCGFIDTTCKENSLYFSPAIVDELKSNKNVEIGTHTFCHYYCLEDGQTIDEFECDLMSAKRIAEDNGIELNSIVFPRNNVNPDYLKICFKHGIKCYRGNAIRFFEKTSSNVVRIKNKICRFLDSYIPLTFKNSYEYNSLKPKKGFPVNIPASRFFRPYNKGLAMLEPIRILRIKREIVRAAKRNELYHLWWHPHNFGADMKYNLKNLESILKCYEKCHKKYGMMSYTMNEMANKINEI